MLSQLQPTLMEVADEDEDSCGDVSDSSCEDDIRNRLGQRFLAPQEEKQDQKSGVPQLTVPNLAFSIPTPARARLSNASSLPEESSSDDSDSETGECTARMEVFQSKVPSLNFASAPLTSRRP
jgi:hypothetical protein